jgi:hypothetical protein
MPSARLSVPVLLVGLLLAAPPARAHEVHLEDGTVLEGKVVRDDADGVVIETTFDGTKRVPRAQVASVDTGVPPLRDQLRFRADAAKDDVGALWELYAWAKKAGFVPELEQILERILVLKPTEVRAHKLLGHEKVDGKWMTPEEKAAWEQAQHEAEMRAKGLVPYKGRWVTPEEKDALEKGLVRDGDEWVTEEEYHRRRGEQKVGGQWVRVGEKEGKAWTDDVRAGARDDVAYLWSPHFDVLHDVSADLAGKVAESAEKAYAAMRTLLRPQGEDYPETIDTRIRLVLLNKLPAYARFTQWFDKAADCSTLVPGWGRAVQKQHAFWWTDPMQVVGVYKFPNVDRTFVSNVLHNMALVLLTRYRFNYHFPSVWLREGFAYHLEMQAIGYSDSFTLGRGGTGSSGSDQPVWADSAKWQAALQQLVNEERDAPLHRLATMGQDQMGYEELVKSWSVVDMLVKWDPVRFKAFVDASKDRDKTEEDALKEAYGVSYRELDRRWRDFVRGGFRAP